MFIVGNLLRIIFCLNLCVGQLISGDLLMLKKLHFYFRNLNIWKFVLVEFGFRVPHLVIIYTQFKDSEQFFFCFVCFTSVHLFNQSKLTSVKVALIVFPYLHTYINTYICTYVYFFREIMLVPVSVLFIFFIHFTSSMNHCI